MNTVREKLRPQRMKRHNHNGELKRTTLGFKKTNIQKILNGILENQFQLEVKSRTFHFLKIEKKTTDFAKRTREECIESSFQKSSTNINSITDFFSFPYYQFIRAPKESTKLEVFFESPSENSEKTHNFTHFCKFQPMGN